MCTFCVPGSYEDQKGALNSLEPELQLVITRHVDAGKGTQVLWMISKCS